VSPPDETVGIDVGATLAKLVLARGGGLRARLPSADLAAVVAQISAWRPRRIAATGGGAAELGERVGGIAVERVGEFEAWARGAPLVAALAGVELPAAHLLVSLGTGTSVLVVRDGRAERVGGSALGGGTLLGLGRLLLSAGSFAEIAGLASRGDRRRVDLSVGDIYRQGGLPLNPDLNAASFGKLASTAPADLAHALMGLVGENVGIIATALARAQGVAAIVYCGSTLDENPALEQALSLATRAFGGEPLYLPLGAYCGAVGAAALVAS
jgi:type II pantothenate kinase